MTIRLGSRVKDTVSEWEGLVTGRFDFHNGSVRYGVSGADSTGQPSSHTFDEPQLEVLNEARAIDAPVPIGDVNLGDAVKDKASGFSGIAIGRYFYLNGCVRIEVAGAKDAKSNAPGNYVFDEEQVTLIKAKAVPQVDGPKRRGGSRDAAPVSR